MRIVRVMGCVAVLYGLLRVIEPHEPGSPWPKADMAEAEQVESAIAENSQCSIGLVLNNMGLEMELVVSGAAMFATAAYLRLRDGGSIIVPTAPVELW